MLPGHRTRTWVSSVSHGGRLCLWASVGLRARTIAVSEHNRCEREQSLAASTIAEAPVCQTCTTCRQQQASRYRIASKQARQGEGRSTSRYLTSAGCLSKLTTGEQDIAGLVFHNGKDAGWKSASVRAEANLQALYCWRQKQ